MKSCLSECSLESSAGTVRDVDSPEVGCACEDVVVKSAEQHVSPHREVAGDLLSEEAAHEDRPGGGTEEMYRSALTHGDQSKRRNACQHPHEVKEIAGPALVIGSEELA